MSDQESGGLIRPVPSAEGLVRIREEAKVLEDNTEVDLTKIVPLAPVEKVEFGDLSGQFAADAGGGLQVDLGLSGLEDGLRQLREQESNARVRELLEQAQEKVGQQRFQTAVVLVNKALALDESNASGWLLKARCYFGFGSFDTALELLETANQHAQDSKTTMMILALRAEVERASTQNLEHDLGELVAQDRHDDALDVVARHLQRRPDDQAALYFRCVILLLAGRVDQARSSAKAATATLDSDQAEPFERLLHQIASAQSEVQLETARQSLRRGDAREATELLATCAAELAGVDMFDRVHAYADDRFIRSSNVLVRGRRRRRSSAQPLTDEALQGVLQWLVREELEAGVAALNADDLASASRSFTAALNIDERCNTVALLQAITIRGEVIRDFNQADGDIVVPSIARMRTAMNLAEQAGRDPALQAESAGVLREARRDLQSLEEIRSRIERARAIQQCIDQFNAQMQYFEIRPIRSVQDRDVARSRFNKLARDVRKLRESSGADQGDDEILEQLATAVGRIQAQLR